MRRKIGALVAAMAGIAVAAGMAVPQECQAQESASPVPPKAEWGKGKAGVPPTFVSLDDRFGADEVKKATVGSPGTELEFAL